MAGSKLTFTGDRICSNDCLNEIAFGSGAGGGGGGTGLTDAQLRATPVPVSNSTGATSAKQDTQITAEQAILAKIIAAPATEAKQDTQITDLGGVTETAPASDTASSGLNGRLQRIAQRLTSLITALGSPFQAGASIGNTTFASTQSGTWTVQPGNTANTTAWKVDGSAVTQPVSGTVTANNTAATVVVSTVFEASKVLKNSAGSLVSLSWLNSRTSSQYLLIMNSTTVPADGAVTLLYPPILMPATSNGMLEFKNALTASTGISVSNSSTGTFTKTIGSADCVFCAQVI